MLYEILIAFFFSSRRRHTRCALVTGVQTCALPICKRLVEHILNEVGPLHPAARQTAIVAARAFSLITLVRLRGTNVRELSSSAGAEELDWLNRIKIGRASCRGRVCQYV